MRLNINNLENLKKFKKKNKKKMTIILGINAFHADTSVCLVKDKNIIAAIEEEE